MDFSLDDLVSASEFGRRPGQYIAAAADGRRWVIVKDNAPIAAVIGVAELRRLERADEADARQSARLGGVHRLYPETHTAGVWLDALGVKDADVTTWNPRASWLKQLGSETLSVPIGTARDGRPVMLNLSEPARGGTGPHGRVVGQTGSGKSAVLEVIVVGLAARYSPGNVQVILAGKGYGSWGSELLALPHISAVFPIGGTSDDWIDDLAARLRREQEERESVLGSAGCKSLGELRRLDAENAPPELVVALDDTLQSAQGHSGASLRNELANVYRKGRSLGIHVLQGQQVAGNDVGREHDGFTVAFRLKNHAQSRQAIGNSAAADLPLYGAALLSCWDQASGEMTLIRFDSYDPSAPVSDNADGPSVSKALTDRITVAASDEGDLDDPQT
jgi:prevent-host-death family protein